MVLIVVKTSPDFLGIFRTIIRGRESTSKFQKYLISLSCGLPTPHCSKWSLNTVGHEKKQISSVLLIKLLSKVTRVVSKWRLREFQYEYIRNICKKRINALYMVNVYRVSGVQSSHGSNTFLLVNETDVRVYISSEIQAKQKLNQRSK